MIIKLNICWVRKGECGDEFLSFIDFFAEKLTLNIEPFHVQAFTIIMGEGAMRERDCDELLMINQLCERLD